MDSNVSKETFLHKFFLLASIEEKSAISVKNLLENLLKSLLNLYLERINFFENTTFEDIDRLGKIALLDTSIESILTGNQADLVFSKLKFQPIVYSSSIALSLSPYVRQSPTIVAKQLLELGNFEPKNTDLQPTKNLTVSWAKSGWIRFYLNANLIATWLEQSLLLLPTVVVAESVSLQNQHAWARGINLLPLQYIHARCYSLLSLATQIKLINSPTKLEKVTWLESSDRLWFVEPAEVYLLRQLFLVVDSFEDSTTDWYKLAVNFSQIIALFLAECRCLGKISRENPEKALARLGLVALSRYWLKKILEEKFNTVAATKL